METTETGSSDTERPGLFSYRVIGRIAKGGMADVYLGEIDFPDQPRQCAIKRIRPDKREEYDVFAFLREAMLGYDLSNDNRGLVRTLHYGIEPDGQPVIIMELARGPNLGLARPALRHKWTLIRRIARDLLVTLGQLHRESVIHRDVSAANILLDLRGRVLLCDLGMARLEVGPQTTRPPTTVPYASPEYLLGGPATRAADVYSLGAVLYEIITDATPYGDNAIRAIRAIEQGQPIAPLPDDTPPDLVRLVPWMLQLQPEDRPGIDACLSLLDQLGAKLASDDDIHDFVNTWLDSRVKAPPPTDPDEPIRRLLDTVLSEASPDGAEFDIEPHAAMDALSRLISRDASDDASPEETARETVINTLGIIGNILDSLEPDSPATDTRSHDTRQPTGRAAATAKPADPAAYVRLASTLRRPAPQLPQPSSSEERSSVAPGPTPSPTRRSRVGRAFVAAVAAVAILLIGYLAGDRQAAQAPPPRPIALDNATAPPQTVHGPDRSPDLDSAHRIAPIPATESRLRSSTPAPSQPRQSRAMNPSPLAVQTAPSARDLWQGGGAWASQETAQDTLPQRATTREVR